ncbi:MAG: hypothetical protein WC734_00145 [Patescibacteria group bacterium]|jgi:hypothetical protein
MLREHEITADPYFQDRLNTAKEHRVLARINLERLSSHEVEANYELPHPVIEGEIGEIGWSEKAVDNIIDAANRGYINIVRLDDERIRIELLPLKILPEQLGHVTELENLQRHIDNGGAVFGSPEEKTPTYLQTVDFAVEGYMDDETVGRRYARVYVNSQALKLKRNVFLDPESLHVTDYEYGYAFCVYGGVPNTAIEHADIIQARKTRQEKGKTLLTDYADSEVDAEQMMNRAKERLRTYIESL